MKPFVDYGGALLRDLGMPRGTFEATIILKAMSVPIIELSCYAEDRAGQYIVANGCLQALAKRYRLTPIRKMCELPMAADGTREA